MNAATQQEQTALTLPERSAVALGESANVAKLRELAAQSASILDVTNADGRKEAHRAGMVLRETRTSITAAGKSAREDAVAFGKAVIALEKDLIAVIQPEEDRVLALRDKFDAQLATEKAAKIAAERARTERIEADIERLREIPSLLIGKSVPDLQFALRDMQSMVIEESRFDKDYVEVAAKVVAAVITAIETMLAAAIERERIAAEAEAARLAEAERLAAEKVALAAQKAENDRVAAEQKAEAKRLADAAAAQQAAAKAAQKEADAKAAAARAEQDRLDAERQARIDAQLAAIAEQERQLAERQAAADARDAEARAQLEREADHPEALMMNAEFDVAREAELANLAAEEAKRVAQVAQTDLPELIPPAQWLDTLPDPIDVTEELLTDGEIIDLVAEAFALSRADAIDRLQAIDFEAARAA